LDRSIDHSRNRDFARPIKIVIIRLEKIVMAAIRPSLIVLLLLALVSRADAQAVQLPTFHQFSVSTTVVVPDRGTSTLGGVRRSSTASSRFGPVRGSRANSVTHMAGGMRVAAQIHDFDAMDRAIVKELHANSTGHNSESISADGAPSLSEIRRRKSLVMEPPGEDLRALIDRAEEAEAQGRLGAARIYLQMATRRAAGPLRQQVQTKYDALVAKSHASNRNSANADRRRQNLDVNLSSSD
jgi:hypothetical protein